MKIIFRQANSHSRFFAGYLLMVSLKWIHLVDRTPYIFLINKFWIWKKFPTLLLRSSELFRDNITSPHSIYPEQRSVNVQIMTVRRLRNHFHQTRWCNTAQNKYQCKLNKRIRWPKRCILLTRIVLVETYLCPIRYDN